jgi:DNA replicative helicase MCM subunit Mcm2 (Cdc46/Mcm family)
MISEHCNLEAFFSEIRGKRKGEAILLALEEATAAERMLLSKKGGAVEDQFTPPAYGEYSESLKDFIHYIRCDIRPKLADDVKHRLFHTYLNSRKPCRSLFKGKEA